MKNATTKPAPRTDCHRIGVLVPADYAYRMSYVLPEENWANTGYRLADARAACESVGYGVTRPMFGTMGACGICGAKFRAGDIWTHMPTGDMLHVGHECAAKVELAMDATDRRQFDRAIATIKANRKKNKAKVSAADRTATIRARYDVMYPGLEAALNLDDPRCKAFAKDFDRFDGLSGEDCRGIIAHAAAVTAR